MLPLLALAVLVVAAIVVLLAQGVAILFAYQMPRLDPLPPGVADAGPLPTVGVVIACRNEVADLPATLDALAAQRYPGLEVVVVDGGSTDGTREEIARRAGTVRAIDEPPLPAGWVGKNFACDVGARAARGDWLLFLDADVRLAPTAVRTVVAWAERERAAAVSVAPTLEMVGRWERLVLPFYVQSVLTRFRAPRTNRDHARSALLNGQCWLVRRTDYEAIGGHASVRGTVLEDIALAQRFRAAGARLRLAWAPGLATTRMYRDRHEMFEGLVKNAHGTEFSAARLAGAIAGLVGLFWLPLGLLPVGIAVGSLAATALGAILWVALFGKHVAFARAVGSPAAYGLLYPVAVGFYVAVYADSLVRGLRRRPVTWKGRAYAVRP